MSIPLNSHCVDCLLYKHLKNARSLGDDATAYAFAKALMQLFIDASPSDSSAILAAQINKLYMKFYDLPQDRFREEKEESNRFVMERLELIRSRVRQSEDPILTALQYAILGNYIDFSALGKTVSFHTLAQMLDKPEDFAFGERDYPHFLQKLSTAKNMLILTDNAGELGFDWVLAEVLSQRYPDLTITFCVRGKPAHNDATREDYAFMKIPFPVIDSGSEIGGTVLNQLGPEARSAMENADVILAKGMGNTETLYGCGYPVYYAFLVKCKRFEQVFQAPHMTPMFVKEEIHG